MKTEIKHSEISKLLKVQLSNFLLTAREEILVDNLLQCVLIKLDFCFANASNKYYRQGDETYFNPFHSGQWCIFLYLYSRVVYMNDKENRILADKLYYLNRSLNGCDIYYEVELPEIFYLDHPLGAIIGRASFKNYFSFRQGCTVGNNKGVFPTIGENVKMLSNSKIIGNSNIGDNVIIASECFIKDENIPPNSIVFGSSPNLVIKRNKGDYNFG